MESETESVATDATPTKNESLAKPDEVLADAKDIIEEEEDEEEEDDDEGDGQV